MDGMLKRMPSKQFMSWVAYDKVEPIGGRRGDWHTASICSTLMNIACGKMKYTPSDFLLEWGPKRAVQQKKQSWQEMKMMAQIIAGFYNDDRPRRGRT